MANNDNPTVTNASHNLTPLDEETIEQETSKLKPDRARSRLLPPESWEAAKVQYANDPRIRYEDIATKLGVHLSTVYNHAIRGQWQLARQEAAVRSRTYLEEKTRQALENVGGSVEGEAKTLGAYLDGLDSVIRKALIGLGAVPPMTPEEDDIAARATERWREMGARESAQIMKWSADAYRELSAHRMLLVGKPTNRLEVSAAPQSFNPDEEQLLERMLNRTVNPNAVREELDMEQGEDGRFKAEAEAEKTMPLDAENDS